MIERTEVLVLTHRLSRTRIFGTGSNVTRDSVVVRLEDGDGLVGWGETYLVPGAVEAARAMTDELVGLDADARRGRADRPTRRCIAGRSAPSRWRSTTCAPGAAAIPVSDLYGERLRGPGPRLRLESRLSRRPVAGGGLDGRGRGRRGMTGSGRSSCASGDIPVDDEIDAIERVVAAASADDLDGRRQRRLRPRTTADGSARRSRHSASAGSRSRCRPTTTWRTRRWPSELSIPLAGGEILESAGRHRAVPARPGSFDLVQPDVSICGGIGGVLEIAAARPGRRPVRRPARLQRRDRARGDPPHPGRPAGPARRPEVGRADPRARRRREPDPDRHPGRAAARSTTAG